MGKDEETKQGKYWCATLNNYTQEEEDYIIGRCTLTPQPTPAITYAVIGREVGKTGTRHLQCYFEFSQRVRLSGLRKLLPRAHWERRRANANKGMPGKLYYAFIINNE